MQSLSQYAATLDYLPLVVFLGCVPLKLAFLTTYPFSVVGTAPVCRPASLSPPFHDHSPAFYVSLCLVKKSVILLFHGWGD